jgi:hypothetical protein
MNISISKATCKTFIIATLGLGAALSANASTMEQFQATFKYSHAEPVHDTYADFQKVASRACQPEGWVSLLRAPLYATRKCEADLIDKAVEQTAFPAMIAYHHQQVGAATGLGPKSRD